MNRLVSISRTEDIPRTYRDSPIGLLLEYHNLNRSLDKSTKAHLLIGMCIDNRKRLRLPRNFGYVIRSAGANLEGSEFNISYAIAIGDVKSMALIGHNNCGMVDLPAKKDQFIQGLAEKAGWEPDAAQKHFQDYAPLFEIGNEIDFVLCEVERLRIRYPKILIAPLFYKIEDNLLYLIRENA